MGADRSAPAMPTGRKAMRRLLEGVRVFEGLSGCNVYLVGSDGDLTLVDAGLAPDPPRIEAQLEEEGITPTDIRRIVLTHSHADHTGGAALLAGRTGAAVLAHAEEVPFIQGGRRPPSSTAAIRFLFWVLSLLGRGAATCRVDRVLADGERLEGSPVLRVLHCPGHTPGSISLYDPARRVIFCGDALFNYDPTTRKPGLRVSIPLFTSDNARALESVRMLARLDADILLPGHGEPLMGDAGRRIRELLAEGSKDPAGDRCG